MGIKYFQWFMNQFPKVTSKVEISNQYLVIYGIELLYSLGELEDEEKSVDLLYVEFMKTLQRCGIKPIVIFNTCKFEGKMHEHVRRRRISIQRALMNAQVVPKSSSVEKVEKAEDAVEVNEVRTIRVASASDFSRTAELEKLGIPWANSYGNSAEDIVALCNMIGAPVLGGDTEFCVYNLRCGFISNMHFDWMNPIQTENGEAIKATLYQADTLLTQYRLSYDSLSFVGLIFNNNNHFPFETFNPFRCAYLQGRRRMYPDRIDNLLRWLANFYSTDAELIEQMTLGIHTGVEEVKLEIQDCLDRFRNPRVLCQVREKIRKADPNLNEILSDESHDKVVTSTPLMQKVLSLALEEIFPYWAYMLLEDNQKERPSVRYFSIVYFDTAHPEVMPLGISKPIREKQYQILAEMIGEKLEVDEYGRVGLDYRSMGSVVAEPATGVPHLLSARSTDDQDDTIEKRVNFFFNALLQDERERAAFNQIITTYPNIAHFRHSFAMSCFWLKQKSGDDLFTSAITCAAIPLALEHCIIAGSVGVEIVNSVNQQLHRHASDHDVGDVTDLWQTEMFFINEEAAFLKKLLGLGFKRSLNFMSLFGYASDFIHSEGDIEVVLETKQELLQAYSKIKEDLTSIVG